MYIRRIEANSGLKVGELCHLTMPVPFEDSIDNLYERLHPEPKERGPEHAEWLYKYYEKINTRYQYIFDKFIETNPKYLKAKKDLKFKEKLDKINDMF